MLWLRLELCASVEGCATRTHAPPPLLPELSSAPQLPPCTQHALCLPRCFLITFRASPRDGAEN